MFTELQETGVENSSCGFIFRTSLFFPLNCVLQAAFRLSLQTGNFLDMRDIVGATDASL